jgi:hypothetical protein
VNDVINRGSFIRTSRNFPRTDVPQLAVEIDRSYLEIARTINTRTIGFFTVDRSTVTGENWYIFQNKRQQGLRQVYAVSDSNLTIPHEITINSVSFFVRVWGEFFDGTNWQNLPYVDVVAATNQIKIAVGNTNIVVTKGAGAPAIVKGLIVLEWVANP